MTPPPISGQAFLRDGVEQGLGLRITAAGARSFVWEGRAKGRVRRITIGQFPALTVLAARRKAREIKAAIAAGNDPANDRQEERREITVKELCDIYLERHAKPHKRSWKEDARRINSRLIPRLGTRRLSDVRDADLHRLQEAVRHESGHFESNRTVVLLRTMFNLAREWRIFAAENPASRVKLFHEDSRERFLSPDELRRINQALLAEPSPYWRAYFPLTLMLGTRKAELLRARWADIDFDQATLRIPETKAGRSHLLPLPAAAIELLTHLPSYGTEAFVFPSQSAHDRHLVEPAKAWQRIRARAGLKDVRIHDLRRTLGSWLAAEGYNTPLIGKALNHRNAASTAVYARLDLDPVRLALEQNSQRMFPATTPRLAAD